MRYGLCLILYMLPSLAFAQTEKSLQDDSQKPSVETTAAGSDEPKPSLDVIIGGQHANISLGINGNVPISGYVNGSLGIATSTIGSANILDLKFGFGTLEPLQKTTSIWSHLFVGQTQILTEEPIGLGKRDSRFWFLEGFIGIGPIGVGYRFNFMRDDDGIYVRKTLIPKNLMFPFMAITTRH